MDKTSIIILAVVMSVALAATTTQAPAAENGFSKMVGSFNSSIKSGFSKVAKTISPKPPQTNTSDATSLYVKANPSPKLYVAAAKMHVSNGNLQDAEDMYKRALKISPKYADALTGYAQLKDKMGSYGEAVALYEKAAKAHPQDATVFNGMGLCHAPIVRDLVRDLSTRGIRQLPPQPRVCREPGHRFHEPGNRTRFEEKRVLPVPEQVEHAWNAGGRDGNFCGHGFEKHRGQSLLEGRQEEEVQRLEDPLHIPPGAQDPEGTLPLRLGGEGFQLGAERPIPHDEKPDVRHPFPQRGRGFQKEIVPLDGYQAPDHAGHRRRPEAECVPQSFHPLEGQIRKPRGNDAVLVRLSHLVPVKQFIPHRGRDGDERIGVSYVSQFEDYKEGLPATQGILVA